MISGRLQDRKGWTLVELMVVISIIGIIGAFAIPGYLAGMPLRRLKADAMDITSNLKYAKMKAVQRNIRVGVYFNSGGSVVNGVDPNAFCIYEDTGADATANEFDSTDGLLKSNIKLRSGVEFDSGSGSWTINPDNTIVFRPNGSASKFGTVVISNTGGVRNIEVIQITGRVRID